MSVYTAVPAVELASLLEAYSLGTAVACEGILDGVENSNYFLTTTRGRYVLTLFESTPAEALPFVMTLMTHLAERGIPAPRPALARNGSAVQTLCGKPAAIVQRLPGTSPLQPDAAQCAAVGRLLGHLHRAVADLPATRASTRGPDWRAITAARVAARLGPADRQLLQEEIAVQARQPLAGLPGGVVHGDLFRDNVLFDDATPSGVIDFYYAAHESFIYDLAVAFADWCFVGDGWSRERGHALLDAYRGERVIETREIEAWPCALRAAGLRFWLSRLQDALYPKPGGMVLIKNPAQCRAVILAARREPARLGACWGG